jgi:hypothetical protein
MPTYTARHLKTLEEKDLGLLSFSEMEEWKKENPEWEIACGKPLLHSGIGLGLKTARNDDSFKDHIKKIKMNNPGNTIDNYYNK